MYTIISVDFLVFILFKRCINTIAIKNDLSCNVSDNKWRETTILYVFGSNLVRVRND